MEEGGFDSKTVGRETCGDGGGATSVDLLESGGDSGDLGDGACGGGLDVVL